MAFAFDDWDEVIARANQTVYGLAAAIWTRDLSSAHLFAREVRAATIWVNGYKTCTMLRSLSGATRR